MVEGYSRDAQSKTKLNALKELATSENGEVKLEREITQEQLAALGIEVPANDNAVSNTPLTIVDILRDNTPKRVYNFEVESLSGELTHNYFVGDEQVWVHNARFRSKTASFIFYALALFADNPFKGGYNISPE